MKLALEITRILPIPADIQEGEFEGKWRAPTYHVGPERMTPLKESLCFITNAALYSVMSGTMLWSAARLNKWTDVTPLLHLSEALYAWQQDWRWFRRPKSIADIDTIEDADRPTASVLYLLDLIHQDHIYENRMWPPEPMFSTVAEALNLTRYNLPNSAKPVFDGWVKGLIDRLDGIAEFPEQGETPDLDEGDNPARREWTAKVMGPPLPPSVLDLSRPCQPEKFEGEWARVLETLDWDNNPYLAQPDNGRRIRLSGPIS